MGGEVSDLPRAHRVALLSAVVAGVVLRLAYIASTRGHTLAGDEPVYHQSALLQVAGKWFWSTAPYGIPHESFQKAPGYQVWAGLWYEIVGSDPDRLFAVQALLLSPVVVVLAFLLARRLFGPAAGVATAFLVAVHPNVWQFEVRMYSESLATPLTLALLLLALTRPPSRRAVLAAGVLLGVLLLVRPTGFIVVPAFAIAWWAVSGARRGLVSTAAVAGIALLVLTPWVVRNLSLDTQHTVPISIQDAAAYGVFNDDAAADQEYPWKWRPVPARDRDLFDPQRPLSDGALRAELQERIRDFISEHPSAVPKAFWHNGIVRLWDLDPPSQSLDDTAFEGRTRVVAGTGLAIYWLMLPLALAGLWQLWRTGRRRVVLALATVALGSSVAYTSDAGTRYRAPVEPVICVLAVGGALAVRGRLRGESPGGDAAPGRALVGAG